VNDVWSQVCSVYAVEKATPIIEKAEKSVKDVKLEKE
jgi:hypothetical protein